MVLDEAHERKLEADKLLVHLAAACKARPKFKVVVMSATIDLAEYTNMIKGNGVPGPYPTSDVKGVTFPVNTIWWEGQAWDPQSNTAMTDLALESVRVYLHSKAGHLLVFVSTVYAVRQLVKDLTGMMMHDKGCAVMGLYGAMNNTEREQVADFSKFPKNQGKRLLCVATNVAEAGITIAGRHTTVLCMREVYSGACATILACTFAESCHSTAAGLNCHASIRTCTAFQSTSLHRSVNAVHHVLQRFCCFDKEI